jgi:SAM-dependent methyltransferase
LAIAAFTRRDDQRRSTRLLSPDEAKSLPPGGDHYRAYVGPADRYDFMGATQFSLLFANGLREHHRVLDFGCGSLRLGKLLIPYLRAGGYHGIEPNRWLIDEAIARETGNDIIELKRPSFAHNDDFDCTTFGVEFDFIIAQSIITHAGPNLFRAFVDSARRALREDGLILISVIEAEAAQTNLPKDGWFYPGCVAYTDLQVRETFATGGLQAVAIPWYHPRARWYAVAHPNASLPTESERRLLTGVVLNDPQFADSLIGLR